jgi:signal peptidase I
MTEKPYYYDWDRFETGKEPDPEPSRPPRKKSGGILEFLVILIVAFALVFGFVRPFVVEAFYIPSESMVPTLEIGDRVLTNKFIYRFEDPERGDVVVFRSVEGGDEDLIKRVVGVPGDTVSVRDGTLFVNGEAQKEPYVNQDAPDINTYGPMRVPDDSVFCMGDNRSNSRDSRFFGPVPYESIEGEAFVTFWPPSRLGLL